MPETIHFELVAPEKRLISRSVEMVVLPGREGDFGVLPEHAPLITSLRPGVIAIYEDNRISEEIFADGGFVEVRPDRLIVLAEHAQPVSALVRDEAEAQVRTLSAALTGSKDEIERGHIADALEIAEAKLLAAA